MAVARYWMGVCLVCAWVLASVPTEAQVSPLNLAPGFPTQLDDAYPLNTGAVALQPAVHFDKTSGNDGRLRQTFDVRWGAGRHLELFVGTTFLRGPLLPGAMDDPRAVRAGVLYRLTHQDGPSALIPSLAIRTTVQVPVYGPGTSPAMRNELLASWDLSSGWYGHINAGYQIATGEQPGLQAPGRNSVWYGRAGVVKSLWYDLGLIATVTYGQDPTHYGKRLMTPEVGLTWGLTRDWILTAGVGRDLGGESDQATLRGNIGLTWVW